MNHVTREEFQTAVIEVGGCMKQINGALLIAIKDLTCIVKRQSDLIIALTTQIDLLDERIGAIGERIESIDDDGEEWKRR